ncbi:hypothetical protein [Heyndrickxia coagulans]|uniref:Uncharacterized protein n=1 Tax=Heyndrickxia coagulans 36D1 TaxID=345219 RepID=G2TR05_HEYCO|nr:hypothetical protein [Heyndrickxia coagulans]AEP00081.1 hypothetical protein Bcoa_0863 [Heyndrickxia coagulans 36D1]
MPSLETGDTTTFGTVTAEANPAVAIKRGNTTIGTGEIGKKVSFRIKISKQKAVTTLTDYATDKAALGIPTLAR